MIADRQALIDEFQAEATSAARHAVTQRELGNAASQAFHEGQQSACLFAAGRVEALLASEPAAAEVATLRQHLADADLAFHHAGTVIEAYEQEVEALRAELDHLRQQVTEIRAVANRYVTLNGQLLTRATPTETRNLHGHIAALSAERDRLQCDLRQIRAQQNEDVTRAEKAEAERERLQGEKDSLPLGLECTGGTDMSRVNKHQEGHGPIKDSWPIPPKKRKRRKPRPQPVKVKR